MACRPVPEGGEGAAPTAAAAKGTTQPHFRGGRPPPAPPSRKASDMLRKLSTKFIAASVRQRSSSACRSNRLFSIHLEHYVTDREAGDDHERTGGSSATATSSSDGDVCAVTADQDAVFELGRDRVHEDAMSEAAVRGSLLASNGLRFDTLSGPQQGALLSQLTLTAYAPGSLVVKQGEAAQGLMVVVSEGDAVTDVATGEWFTRGKLFCIESLAFGQHACPYTLRVGEKYVVIACLPIEAYGAAAVPLRLNYMRSKYSILDTLSDSRLRKLRFKHRWLEPKETLEVTGHVALMTHGVAREGQARHGERLFPGQIAGVSELMSDGACSLVADTFVGVALLSRSQFGKCMTQELPFMHAINDICYQHSVIVENYASAVAATALEELEGSPESWSPPTCTTTLVRRFEEDGSLRINDYRVLKKIGTGATAAVFKVIDTTCEGAPPRVLKIVKRKGAEKSIARELRALRELRHPNLVRALEFIDSPGSSCVIVVQELAEWGSLLGVVLPMREAKACALDCARAIEFMHDRGFTHNDIKPANVLRSKTGIAKLADFGCTTGSDEGADARPRGTPAFMGPEVLRNEACYASDIWALTVTLFCLVYGTVPFRNVTTQSLREAICYGEIPLQHIGTSEDEVNFGRLCEEGLHKDHRRRITLEDMVNHAWLIHNPASRNRGSVGSGSGGGSAKRVSWQVI